jgi:hypothetical protein
MRYESVGPAMVRIELYHGLLVFALLLLLVLVRLLEVGGPLLGGLFMGLNFFLLSQGIRRVLTPFVEKGRVLTGVFLFIFKLIFFLGLLLVLFFRVHFDLLSFAVGISSLLAAIVLHGGCSYQFCQGVCK